MREKAEAEARRVREENDRRMAEARRKVEEARKRMEAEKAALAARAQRDEEMRAEAEAARLRKEKRDNREAKKAAERAREHSEAEGRKQGPTQQGPSKPGLRPPPGPCDRCRQKKAECVFAEAGKQEACEGCRVAHVACKRDGVTVSASKPRAKKDRAAKATPANAPTPEVDPTKELRRLARHWVPVVGKALVSIADSLESINLMLNPAWFEESESEAGDSESNEEVDEEELRREIAEVTEEDAEFGLQWKERPEDAELVKARKRKVRELKAKVHGTEVEPETGEEEEDDDEDDDEDEEEEEEDGEPEKKRRKTETEGSGSEMEMEVAQ